MVGSNTDHLTGWWLFSRRGQAYRSLTSGIGPHDPELHFDQSSRASASLSSCRQQSTMSVAADCLSQWRLQAFHLVSREPSCFPPHIPSTSAAAALVLPLRRFASAPFNFSAVLSHASCQGFGDVCAREVFGVERFSGFWESCSRHVCGIKSSWGCVRSVGPGFLDLRMWRRWRVVIHEVREANVMTDKTTIFCAGDGLDWTLVQISLRQDDARVCFAIARRMWRNAWSCSRYHTHPTEL